MNPMRGSGMSMRPNTAAALPFFFIAAMIFGSLSLREYPGAGMFPAGADLGAESGAPHSGQKAALSAALVPQFGQNMANLRLRAVRPQAQAQFDFKDHSALKNNLKNNNTVF